MNKNKFNSENATVTLDNALIAIETLATRFGDDLATLRDEIAALRKILLP